MLSYSLEHQRLLPTVLYLYETNPEILVAIDEFSNSKVFDLTSLQIEPFNNPAIGYPANQCKREGIQV
jgi:hypothetical protein